MPSVSARGQRGRSIFDGRARAVLQQNSVATDHSTVKEETRDGSKTTIKREGFTTDEVGRFFHTNRYFE